MALPSMSCPPVNLDLLAVAFVTLLITWLPISSQAWVSFHYLGGWSTSALLHLAAFDSIIVLLWRNYYLAVTTDPGRIPPAWKPPYLQKQTRSKAGIAAGAAPAAGASEGCSSTPDDTSEYVEVSKSSPAPRFCRTCRTYKPPRSHHCSACRRCVLRMDHHCPWVGNCVGHANYQHFFRFLIYVDVGCAWCFGLLCGRIGQLFKAMQSEETWYRVRHPSQMEIVVLVVNTVALIPIMLSVGFLSMYQFYCLLHNTTTIESWEKEKVATMVRRGKIRQVMFPYDLGIIRNIKAVLGPNPLLWWWPQQMMTGGLSFPVSDKLKGEKSPFSSGSESEVRWPPPEYDRERQQERRPPAYGPGARTRYETPKRHRQQQARRPARVRPGHVRRCSEGYIVKDITLEDREAMLAEADKEVQPSTSQQPFYDSESEEDEYSGESLSSEFDSYSGSESEDLADDKEATRPPPECSAAAGVGGRRRTPDFEVTPKYLEWERRQRAAWEARRSQLENTTVHDGAESMASATLRSRSPTKKHIDTGLLVSSSSAENDGLPLAHLFNLSGAPRGPDMRGRE